MFNAGGIPRQGVGELEGRQAEGVLGVYLVVDIGIQLCLDQYSVSSPLWHLQRLYDRKFGRGYQLHGAQRLVQFSSSSWSGVDAHRDRRMSLFILTREV